MVPGISRNQPPGYPTDAPFAANFQDCAARTDTCPNTSTDMTTYVESANPLPQCLAGATSGTVDSDCWQLTVDPPQCPASGQRIGALRTAAEIVAGPLTPGTKLKMQCRTCPAVAAGSPVVAGCDY
jgi:hypothetical protein